MTCGTIARPLFLCQFFNREYRSRNHKVKSIGRVSSLLAWPGRNSGDWIGHTHCCLGYHCNKSPRSRMARPPESGGRNKCKLPVGAKPNRPRRAYSRTWMFFLAQISLRIWGHTLTVTSPRCAFLSRSMRVRDWPMPPPMLSGISFFTMAW